MGMAWSVSGDLPITEQVAASLIRLPLHTQLTMDDIKSILKRLEQVLRQWA
jgi:dTDP-4-amino-4,6-dideoxygalactose transaminase